MWQALGKENGSRRKTAGRPPCSRGSPLCAGNCCLACRYVVRDRGRHGPGGPLKAETTQAASNLLRMRFDVRNLMPEIRHCRVRYTPCPNSCRAQDRKWFHFTQGLYSRRILRHLLCSAIWGISEQRGFCWGNSSPPNKHIREHKAHDGLPVRFCSKDFRKNFQTEFSFLC